jgi:endonuclease YncB( thermonuclease family)
MHHLLLLLAARVVLSGTQPIQAEFMDATEGGLVTVKTDQGTATVHLLGMECGPVKATDKCLRSGDPVCHDQAVLGRKALARVKQLLSGQSLIVTPCMEFEEDKPKRTWGFIQWSDDKDLTSVLVQEGLCKKLSRACMRPSR